MIRLILNQFPARYGTYTAENNKIRRTFSNGFSYIVEECNSPEEAQRIVSDLNYLTGK
jgi:hypothetical protein